MFPMQVRREFQQAWDWLQAVENDLLEGDISRLGFDVEQLRRACEELRVEVERHQLNLAS